MRIILLAIGLFPLLSLIGCTGSTPAPRGQPAIAATVLPRGPIFDLTAPLTAAQREINARIVPHLPAHEFEEETELDPVARSILEDPLVDPATAIRGFWRQGGAEQMAAGARGGIALAQKRFAEGNLAEAAGLALDIYLSSSPSRARLEAFRLICHAAPPETSEHWLRCVEEGRQDPWLILGASEWRAAIAARRAR